MSKPDNNSTRTETQPYGYIYRTTITLGDEVYYYVGMSAFPEFDPRYAGSGTFLKDVKKNYTDYKFHTKPIRWAYSQQELGDLERLEIAKARKRYGDRCVNVADGGYGGTPEATRRMWQRPEYRANQAAAVSRPDFKARFSATQREAQSRPDVRAKLATTRATPECKAKEKAARDALLAETLPMRLEAKALRLRAKSEGITLPPSPATLSPAEDWRAFADALRVLVGDIDKSDVFRGEWKVIYSKLRRAGIPRPQQPPRDASPAVWSKFLKEAQKLLGTSARNPPAYRSPEAKTARDAARGKANKPLRGRYYNELVPKMVAAGVLWPKRPHPSQTPEAWQRYIEELEQLLARARRRPVRVENLMDAHL